MKTSPSQVENANTCLRLWAWGQVHGQWQPQRQEAADGDELHQHLENYVTLGVKVDTSAPMGRLAALALPYLPDPADEPVCEEPLQVPYGDHVFNCKPDLNWNSPAGPVVIDYKKKNNFRFILTPQKLRVNLPAAVYGLGMMRKYRTDRVWLRWLYFKLEEPIAIKPVEVMVDRDDVTAVLRSHHKRIDEMQRIKDKKLPIADIPASYESCMKYGPKHPCFYKPMCDKEDAC